jgi:hypothetical protein
MWTSHLLLKQVFQLLLPMLLLPLKLQQLLLPKLFQLLFEPLPLLQLKPLFLPLLLLLRSRLR